MSLITQEQLAERYRYCSRTGRFFNRMRPDIPVGYQDHQGYLRIKILGRPYRAHRLAWLYTHGEWPDGQIDHVNCDKTDNRIENLRICTHQQNNHNQPIRASNTSGVKGVCWMKARGKWHVQVCKDRKIYHGGLYERIEDAESAAIALREKLHGEFANHG